MRNFGQVINQMIEKIPDDKVDFINELKKNYEDASYKAPEDVSPWNRTQLTLMKHIPQPENDWEFEVISIFTNKPIDGLRDAIHKVRITRELKYILELVREHTITLDDGVERIKNLFSDNSEDKKN